MNLTRRRRHNSGPVAFLSYAHLDENAEAGRISLLARTLEGRMSLQLGFPFQMFLDRRDIGWGERWPREIDEALEDALFLIPVLTPAYFNSRFCQSEYLHLLER